MNAFKHGHSISLYSLVIGVTNENEARLKIKIILYINLKYDF